MSFIIFITPVLEKAFNVVIGGAGRAEIEQNPSAFASKVETKATGPLERMGLAVVSEKIHNVRAGWRSGKWKED